MAVNLQCGDFLEFQDALRKMRDIDDKIVYALNVSIPTDSFKGKVDPASMCKDLYSKLTLGYSTREEAIKRCILASADQLKDLKTQREENSEDRNLFKKLKAEQRKLHMLQSELSVEEVLKNRTTKVLSERCRMYYKPDSVTFPKQQS